MESGKDDINRLSFEAQISSVLPNFPFSSLSKPGISNIPPFLDPYKNVYLAPTSTLISPLPYFSAPSSHFFPRLPLSYPSALLSLNPLYRTPIVPTSTKTTSSSTVYPSSDVAGVLPQTEPPLSPVSTIQEPKSLTRTSKRKKDFSIAALLGDGSGKEREPKREALPSSIGISSEPSREVNYRKRRLEDDEELSTPAKSAKTSLPDRQIPPALLNSPSSEVDLNLVRASTIHSSSNSTPTDSGIMSGSLSNSSATSTPSSSNTSITQQIARTGLAQILHYNQLLYRRTTALNIVTPDEDGDTHLHLAIASEKTELVRKYIQTLTSLRMKLDLKNHLRQTPLHVAVITNQPVIIRALIAAGANVNVSDRNGDNCVHLACKWGDQDTMSALCESKNPEPEFDALNFNGIAPLHLAAINNNIECIKVLVQNNIQRNIGDGTSGKTALHHAIEGKHYDLIRLLVQFDFDVNMPTFSGVTPLQFASGLQEQEIVSYLIHNGTIATKNIPAVQAQDKSNGGTHVTEATSSTTKQTSGVHT